MTTRSVAGLATAADTKADAFVGVFGLLAPHGEELERFLQAQLAVFEPEIRAMVGGCLGNSGGRVRPALAFLGGWRGVGEVAPDLVRVAAVVEFIHLATRVHDDILDEAEGHAGGRVVSGDDGPTPRVLLGDALFAHGLHLATQFPTTEICAAITEATRRVCTGEIVQTLRRRSVNVTRAGYLRVVELKTAELFRVACLLGARVAGAEPGLAEAAGEFGRHFGMAYQLYEDLADCFGEEASTGRKPGAELARGKLTLPLLALLERLPSAEAEALRAEITGKRVPQVALRLRQMREFFVFTESAEAVQAELTAAANVLHEWHGRPATALLLGLGEAMRAQVAALRPVGAA